MINSTIFLIWLLINASLALLFGWIGAKLRNPWAYVVFGSCSILSIFSLLTCVAIIGLRHTSSPLPNDILRALDNSARYYIQSLATAGFAIGFLLFALSLRNLRAPESTPDASS